MAHDYREAGHLPNQRAGARPAPPEELPRHRRGIAPQMRSRYPDYDVLEERDHWDAATRAVIEERLARPAGLRFFDASEAAALRAFCDLVTAQDREPRVPVLEHVDADLADGKLQGYRYADMPDDRETWRLAARGLDEAAHERGAPSFADAAPSVQEEICEALEHGELRRGAWEKVNVSRAWSVLMRDILSAFYAHPWAWNEIGFGGPAYPRGYARLGIGLSETWEGREAFERDPVQDVQQRGLDA